MAFSPSFWVPLQITLLPRNTEQGISISRLISMKSAKISRSPRDLREAAVTEAPHCISAEKRTVTEPERTSLKNHTTHITKTLIVHMEVIRWDPSQTMQLLRKNPIQHNTVVRYGNWCTIETSIVTNGLIHCVERVEKREEQIQKIF